MMRISIANLTPIDSVRIVTHVSFEKRIFGIEKNFAGEFTAITIQTLIDDIHQS